MKIKWKVGAKPSGSYASFHKRDWPSGEVNGHAAVSLDCSESYRGEYLNQQDPTGFDGKPLEIFVRIADWSNYNLGVAGSVLNANKGHFTWRTLKVRYRNIADAKAAAVRCLEVHSHFLRKEQSSK